VSHCPGVFPRFRSVMLKWLGTRLAWPFAVFSSWLARGLDAGGFWEAMLRARERTQSPWLTVVTYHRVVTREDPRFDAGVVDATAVELDRQLAMMRRYFTPITLEDLLDALDGRALPRNPALVTFDDGYRECHDVALPILQRHGFRAAFFLVTEYINQRRVFWWDRIAYVTSRSRRPRIELDYPNHLRLRLGRDRSSACTRLLSVVKSSYALDVERFLVELASSADVEWTEATERRYADELVMTWDHVRALSRAGMALASHTRTHRVLQTLHPSELVSELAGSRQDLEAQINRPVRAVSFPVGRSIAHSDTLRDAVRSAGYALGFSNGSGATRLTPDFDRLDVRRLCTDLHLSPARFRRALAIAPLSLRS
jgi:peptidoglycan/xylan/chitin deacetylase (PgdA/CDA1 family)